MRRGFTVVCVAQRVVIVIGRTAKLVNGFFLVRKVFESLFKNNDYNFTIVLLFEIVRFRSEF